MSRSEIDPREERRREVNHEARRATIPNDSIESAFRWLAPYRSQPIFVHLADRVPA